MGHKWFECKHVTLQSTRGGGKPQEISLDFETWAQNFPGVLFRFSIVDGKRLLQTNRQRLAKLVGTDPEQLIQSPEYLIDIVYHGDQARLVREVSAAIQTSTRLTTELRIGSGSNQRWLKITTETSFENGNCVWNGMVDDITDVRKESDCIINAIAAFDIGFILFGPDRRMVLCNHKYKEIFHRIAHIITQNMHFDEIVKATAASGLFPEEIGHEDSFISKERDRYWSQDNSSQERLLASGRWVLATQRRTIDGGALSTWADITQLRQRERELEDIRMSLEFQGDVMSHLADDLEAARREADQQRRLAQSANHAKSEFLAQMSHELRSPLNAILGFSQIIESRMFGPISNDRYIEYASDIRKSGEYLLSIINDILDISRIESKQYCLNEIPLEINNLIQSALRLLRQHALHKQITITTNVPTELWIHADARAIRQVLINMITNAIKFTPAGGAISVNATKDTNITISITDTGIGIPADQIEIVQKPFGTANRYGTEAEIGSGLGLSISKGLIEAHGGQLNLTSTIGVGTTATVTLPLERSSDPPIADQSNTQADKKMGSTVSLGAMGRAKQIFGKPEC